MPTLGEHLEANGQRLIPLLSGGRVVIRRPTRALFEPDRTHVDPIPSAPIAPSSKASPDPDSGSAPAVAASSTPSAPAPAPEEAEPMPRAKKKARVHTPQATKDEALRRILAGEGKRAVALDLGIAENTVYRWLRNGDRPSAGAKASGQHVDPDKAQGVGKGAGTPLTRIPALITLDTEALDAYIDARVKLALAKAFAGGIG